jgi:hypothetical protein
MRRANGLDEFYSRTLGDESCELFLDASGYPTTGYPHVHVVHHGGGSVDVIASDSSGNHPYRRHLDNPSGSEVDDVVSTARSYIRSSARSSSSGGSSSGSTYSGG